ncbi:esterase [Macrobrachium rosenbergii nudivirus]|nr:esterase [Macrobrachium rosenbergii nudivirus]
MEDIKKKINPYLVVTTILSLIFILLILYVIITVLYPKKPLDYIRRKLHVEKNLEMLQDDCTDITTYEAKTCKFTGDIYAIKKDTNDKTIIIIDIPGGAFISACNFVKPFTLMDINYDVISISYPVLPYGNFKRSLNYLTEVINHIITTEYDNPKIILTATSAGSYYAVKLINNGTFKDNIIKFISTSGYFGYETIENVITLIGDKGYLRRFNNSTLLTCTPIDPTIKSLYAVGADDFLKESTVKFLQLSGENGKMLTYPGDHCFYLSYNDKSTREYYKDMELFMKA